MENIGIQTTNGEFNFIGKHLPEKHKESPNWHYYQAPDSNNINRTF